MAGPPRVLPSHAFPPRALAALPDPRDALDACLRTKSGRLQGQRYLDNYVYACLRSAREAGGKRPDRRGHVPARRRLSRGIEPAEFSGSGPRNHGKGARLIPTLRDRRSSRRGPPRLHQGDSRRILAFRAIPETCPEWRRRSSTLQIARRAGPTPRVRKAERRLDVITARQRRDGRARLTPIVTSTAPTRRSSCRALPGRRP